MTIMTPSTMTRVLVAVKAITRMGTRGARWVFHHRNRFFPSMITDFIVALDPDGEDMTQRRTRRPSATLP
jgi:hypothetical protein